MNLPILNTNSIPVSAPGSVATPTADYVSYFFDSTNSNKLSYKDDAGNVVVADQSPEGIDECVCDLLCNFTTAINNAMPSGTIDFTNYQAALQTGFQVTTPSGTYSVGALNP